MAADEQSASRQSRSERAHETAAPDLYGKFLRQEHLHMLRRTGSRTSHCEIIPIVLSQCQLPGHQSKPSMKV